MAQEQVETCKKHSGVVSRISSLEDSNTKQWNAIEKLQNRLPVWATIVISLLTFGLGSALTYASLAARLSG